MLPSLALIILVGLALGLPCGQLVLSVAVLAIQGDKLDTYAKARGMQQAEQKMVEALKQDRATRFGAV
ncbi:hypothetical protein H6B10_16875, partial [Gemmiger formicilis]|nr:hypothetical protein [Gemmiger formicilis]